VSRAAAFLDRDGVINEDRGYVHRWSDFVFLPGAVDALKRLQDQGFLLVIVTNQSGIGRGYFTEQAYSSLTNRMIEGLQSRGVRIDGVYHCPHLPSAVGRDATCSCRKPLPGLIERAIEDLLIDRARSFIVGDKPSDIAAGNAARLGSAYQVGEGKPAADATAYFPDLAHCVDALLRSLDLGRDAAAFFEGARQRS
jgi:D-glycero-D-manno-heptose 1,7-bisphosphate phosphatase